MEENTALKCKNSWQLISKTRGSTLRLNDQLPGGSVDGFPHLFSTHAYPLFLIIKVLLVKFCTC